MRFSDMSMWRCLLQSTGLFLIDVNLNQQTQIALYIHFFLYLQFQKRLYKNVGWFRCGKKGFGLQVLEDVSMGSFLIEYVGEVCAVS